jgi:hypothetical protein
MHARRKCSDKQDRRQWMLLAAARGLVSRSSKSADGEPPGKPINVVRIVSAHMPHAQLAKLAICGDESRTGQSHLSGYCMFCESCCEEFDGGQLAEGKRPASGHAVCTNPTAPPIARVCPR